MTNDEIKAFIVKDWFSKQGTVNNLDATLYSIYPNTGAGIDNTVNFLLYKAIKNAEYPTVFGYYVAPDGKLYCRHFYKSYSEAAWRVGTGLRANGAWVKSAENAKDSIDSQGKLVQGHVQGGYIFEGMVNLLLERELERFYLASKDSGNFLASMSSLINIPSRSSEIVNFIKFFINPRNTTSGIVGDYARVRIWHTVVPPEVILTVPVEELKKNSVHHQQSTSRTKVATPSIKDDDALWTFINDCLTHQATGDLYSYAMLHEPLRETVTITTYTLNRGHGLSPVYIQIAHSENKPRKFNNSSGFECSISSPICWVRSVYIGNTLSTYGNYTEYPIDLCFLVQKPLDYIEQTSEFLAIRAGVGAKNNVNGVVKFTDEKTNKDHSNIIKKGSKDTYLLLALFDEKYSQLIQAYKRKHHFEMFKWKSAKFTLSTVSAFDVSVSRIVPVLCELIVDSCDRYLYLNSVAGSGSKVGGTGHHGSTGINRVNAFKDSFFNNVINIEKLNVMIYTLFNDNKVGTKSFSGLFGIGGGINTNKYSYFTIFCTYLLQPFFIADKVPSDFTSNGIFKAKLIDINQLTGAKNTIARLYLKAIDLQLNADNLQALSPEQSAALLVALKRIGGTTTLSKKV